MSRFSIAGRSTVVATAARAGASLFSIAAKGFTLREFGVFNTTAVAFAASLVRFTNATGVGAGLTEVPWDPDDVAQITGFAGHTADGAVSAPFAHMPIGAAVGSGLIFTFGDNGIKVLKGTANGIGIICPTGTGQIFDYHMVWDE